MTTYADLITDIRAGVKRGDIDDKIARALRLITIRAHNTDYYWRDLAEANMLFVADTNVMLDTSAQLTRFRQVNYLRYYDPDSDMVGPFLDAIAPQNLLDEYSYYKVDCFYMAGVNLTIRFQYATSGARIGYFQNPDVEPATYNSWIKDTMPDLLVEGSIAYIYNTTGKQEEARALNRMIGFEPDPANRAPGNTMVDQLRAANLQQQVSAL